MKKLIDEKLLKFLIVGVINTLVGTAIMFGLYNMAGWGYWPATAANYILTSVLSFFLNRRFTFRYGKSAPGAMLRFGANIALCYAAAYSAAKPLVRLLLSGYPAEFSENIAMLAGMCIFTGLNYLGQRFFVFKE